MITTCHFQAGIVVFAGKLMGRGQRIAESEDERDNLRGSGRHYFLARAIERGNGAGVWNPVTALRWTGWMEAVSFVLLVGIAMPLKYGAGKPEAVRVLGMLHGILFVACCLALARVMVLLRWPIGRGAFVFVMALLPFGPVLIDGKLKRYERESVPPR